MNAFISVYRPSHKNKTAVLKVMWALYLSYMRKGYMGLHVINIGPICVKVFTREIYGSTVAQW